MKPTYIPSDIGWIESEPSGIVPEGSTFAWEMNFAPDHRMKPGLYMAHCDGCEYWRSSGAYVEVTEVQGQFVRFRSALNASIPAVASGDKLYRVKTHAMVLEERLVRLEAAVARLDRRFGR